MDAVRGCLLIAMAVYHIFWDIVCIFGIRSEFFFSGGAYVLQQFGCCGFITLSGICWRLSDNIKTHIKNGISAFCCGLIITAVSLCLRPNSHIWFGVLTFMGSAMLIMIPLDKLLRRVPNGIGAALALAAYLVCRGIEYGTVFFGTLRLPTALYRNMFTTYLGFMHGNFYSADYFGLMPWMFLYIFGYFMSPVLIRPEYKVLYKKIPIAGTLGKNSLLFYMLHQPVIYGVLWAVMKALHLNNT